MAPLDGSVSGSSAVRPSVRVPEGSLIDDLREAIQKELIGQLQAKHGRVDAGAPGMWLV